MSQTQVQTAFRNVENDTFQEIIYCNSINTIVSVFDYIYKKASIPNLKMKE
jgi:hypothetical protein